MSNSSKSALTTITDTATVTITNDDSATVTIADNTTAENSGPSVVTLSVDNAVQGGFWVTVLRADGTATLADSDYTAGTDNVNFARVQLERVRPLTFPWAVTRNSKPMRR